MSVVRAVKATLATLAIVALTALILAFVYWGVNHPLALACSLGGIVVAWCWALFYISADD